MNIEYLIPVRPGARVCGRTVLNITQKDSILEIYLDLLWAQKTQTSEIKKAMLRVASWSGGRAGQDLHLNSTHFTMRKYHIISYFKLYSVLTTQTN